VDSYNPVDAFPSCCMRENVNNYLGSDIQRLLNMNWKVIYNPDLVAASHVLSHFSLFDRLANVFSSERLPNFTSVPQRSLPTAVSQKLSRVGCCLYLFANLLTFTQDSRTYHQLEPTDRASAGISPMCTNQTGGISDDDIQKRHSAGFDSSSKRS
jgi:hypothetical protein